MLSMFQFLKYYFYVTSLIEISKNDLRISGKMPINMHVSNSKCSIFRHCKKQHERLVGQHFSSNLSHSKFVPAVLVICNAT